LRRKCEYWDPHCSSRPHAEEGVRGSRANEGVRVPSLVPKRVLRRAVARLAPLKDDKPGGRAIYPPRAVRRAEDGDVGTAVAVVVGWYGNVGRDAELIDRLCRVAAAVADILPSFGRTIHGHIRLAVAVVVGRHDFVGSETPLLLDLASVCQADNPVA